MAKLLIKSLSAAVFFGLGFGVCLLSLYLKPMAETIAPEEKRLFWVLLHVRPEWYLYAASCVFLLTVSAFIFGRLLLAARSREWAVAQIRSNTREALAHWRGRCELAEGALKILKTELEKTKRHLRAFRSWRAGVLHAVRGEFEVDEVEQEKLTFANSRENDRLIVG